MSTSETEPEVQERLIVGRSFGRVTLRAILISVVLTLLNFEWDAYLEIARWSFPTMAAPFYNVVFTLLLVCGINYKLRQWRPTLAFTRAELLTVYVMVSISCAVYSHEMQQVLIPVMAFPFFYANPTNRYMELFADRMPRWLIVDDQASLRNFFYGSSSFYDPSNFRPWIVPVFWWSVFAAVLLFTLLCMNSILRRQWVESERLTFPIIQLPLEMTDPGGSFFRDRRMWLGFGVAGAVTFLAGLHYLYPSVPCLQITRREMGGYITNPPWNHMGSVPMGFYFWAIGIAFLMPIELSFSCWFFFWAIKMERVLCYALGYSSISVSGGGLDSSYPFLNSQSYGAYLGFFVVSIWTSRRYLGRVWRTAFRGSGEEDESREAMPYRTAILGAGAGFLVMGAFALRMGMSPWVIPVFFGLYALLSITATRIRSELGFPAVDMRDMAPPYAIITAFGSERLTVGDYNSFSLMNWYNHLYNPHPAPHQMEAYKLAERSNTPARQMFKVALIAGLIAMPLGFVVLLPHYYRWGCATSNVAPTIMLIPNTTYAQLTSWIMNPVPPNGVGMGFVSVGFALSFLMGWMRLRYLWFPLHPLAYAIAHSWGVTMLWTPIFVGGTIKYFILRFGGLPTYRRALPFFFGLILGEITVGSLWTIVGLIFGIQTYDFWPGAMRY